MNSTAQRFQGSITKHSNINSPKSSSNNSSILLAKNKNLISPKLRRQLEKQQQQKSGKNSLLLSPKPKTNVRKNQYYKPTQQQKAVVGPSRNKSEEPTKNQIQSRLKRPTPVNTETNIKNLLKTIHTPSATVSGTISASVHLQAQQSENQGGLSSRSVNQKQKVSSNKKQVKQSLNSPKNGYMVKGSGKGGTRGRSKVQSNAAKSQSGQVSKQEIVKSSPGNDSVKLLNNYLKQAQSILNNNPSPSQQIIQGTQQRHLSLMQKTTKLSSTQLSSQQRKLNAQKQFQQQYALQDQKARKHPPSQTQQKRVLSNPDITNSYQPNSPQYYTISTLQPKNASSHIKTHRDSTKHKLHQPRKCSSKDNNQQQTIFFPSQNNKQLLYKSNQLSLSNESSRQNLSSHNQNNQEGNSYTHSKFRNSEKQPSSKLKKLQEQKLQKLKDKQKQQMLQNMILYGTSQQNLLPNKKLQYNYNQNGRLLAKTPSNHFISQQVQIQGRNQPEQQKFMVTQQEQQSDYQDIPNQRKQNTDEKRKKSESCELYRYQSLSSERQQNTVSHKYQNLHHQPHLQTQQNLQHQQPIQQTKDTSTLLQTTGQKTQDLSFLLLQTNQHLQQASNNIHVDNNYNNVTGEYALSQIQNTSYDKQQQQQFQQSYTFAPMVGSLVQQNMGSQNSTTVQQQQLMNTQGNEVQLRSPNIISSTIRSSEFTSKDDVSTSQNQKQIFQSFNRIKESTQNIAQLQQLIVSSDQLLETRRKTEQSKKSTNQQFQQKRKSLLPPKYFFQQQNSNIRNKRESVSKSPTNYQVQDILQEKPQIQDEIQCTDMSCISIPQEHTPRPSNEIKLVDNSKVLSPENRRINQEKSLSLLKNIVMKHGGVEVKDMNFKRKLSGSQRRKVDQQSDLKSQLNDEGQLSTRQLESRNEVKNLTKKITMSQINNQYFLYQNKQPALSKPHPSNLPSTKSFPSFFQPPQYPNKKSRVLPQSNFENPHSPRTIAHKSSQHHSNFINPQSTQDNTQKLPCSSQQDKLEQAEPVELMLQTDDMRDPQQQTLKQQTQFQHVSNHSSMHLQSSHSQADLSLKKSSHTHNKASMIFVPSINSNFTYKPQFLKQQTQQIKQPLSTKNRDQSDYFMSKTQTYQNPFNGARNYMQANNGTSSKLSQHSYVQLQRNISPVQK